MTEIDVILGSVEVGCNYTTNPKWTLYLVLLPFLIFSFNKQAFYSLEVLKYMSASEIQKKKMIFS